MSKGYIYEDGELVEVQECSVDGQKSSYCKNCGKNTVHYLDCISSKDGYVWRCSKCNEKQ